MNQRELSGRNDARLCEATAAGPSFKFRHDNGAEAKVRASAATTAPRTYSAEA